MKQTVDSYTRSLDCVHCGLCLEACPTYRELGLESDSPRGRIYLMRAIAESRVEDVAAVRPHLDRCLDCRACETVCPSGVRYGAILEAVRADLEQTLPRRTRGARLRRMLLRHLVARQRRLRIAFHLAALAERLGLRRVAVRLGLLPRAVDALVPRVPPRRDRRPLAGTFAPVGPRRGRVALFTGCVMEQVFGRINRATAELLTANGFEVVVPSTQGCCGALLLHDGLSGEARRLAAANVAAFEALDVDAVVNNSAGCGAALKDYGELLGTAAARRFAAHCRDVTEFLGGVGLAVEPAPFPHRVAYDAPCHLCHGQGVRREPPELLRRVPGLELVPHDTSEDCCGSAGIYNLVHRELAARIGDRKAAALIASGAEVVATGNPGCMMQIRARLAQAGARPPVVHPVELLLPER